MMRRGLSSLSGMVLVLTAMPVFGGLPYPPEPVNGSVLVCGGGKLPESLRDEFFKLAGGKEKARIVIITVQAAEKQNPSPADELAKGWKDLSAADVCVLTLVESAKIDAAFARRIREATAVWMTSDDEAKLMSTCRDTEIERELLSLLKRGGVIGGAPVVTDLTIAGGSGFGFLPGIIVDAGKSDGTASDRLRKALQKTPDHVGMRIDERTAIVVRGRRIKTIGEQTVTVCWAKSPTKEFREDVLKTGGELDLTQILRAAHFRALRPSFPAKEAATPEVASGSLVIVGGGGTTPEIMNKFFELAGGKDALVVAIPTANELEIIPDDPGDAKYLRKWGGTNVKILHTRDRKKANDPEFSKILTEARGVWFGGGRQWRFIDSYEGTLTEKRFREVLARGGVIGGSSAGASIQSEYMPRGHPLGNTVMAAEGYERGFGYLPGCAVDQHFFARKRTEDMTGLMRQYPQLLGIGIDEATAIIVKGHTAEVVGKTKAAFYDFREGPPRDGKDYVEVSAGGSYDLKERKRLK